VDSGSSKTFPSFLLLLASFLYFSFLLSRYESSGYDYTSSPQTYTTYRQVYTRDSPQQSAAGPSNSANLSYTSEPESNPNGSVNPDSSIESGPSFNESLQRFKTASGHNAQLASWKTGMSSRSASSSHVQRRVEETRTMITQSSQKSYHIE